MRNTMTKSGAVEKTGALPRVWSNLSNPAIRRLAVTVAPVLGGTLPASAAHAADFGPITRTCTTINYITINYMDIPRFRTERPPV